MVDHFPVGALVFDVEDALRALGDDELRFLKALVSDGLHSLLLTCRRDAQHPQHHGDEHENAAVEDDRIHQDFILAAILSATAFASLS